VKFDFQFGKKKSSIFRYAIIGVVFTSLVTGVSQCTHIPEENIYDFVDEVQRKYFPQTDLNDIILNTPQLLDRRVHRDVDKTIREYESDWKMIERGMKTPGRSIDIYMGLASRWIRWGHHGARTDFAYRYANKMVLDT